MNDASEPDRPPAAPAGTRLGQLQRGRGAGFLAAIAAEQLAIDDVLQCIVEDPRIDRQIEDRARYYAELIVALDVPIEPIVTALRSCPAPLLGHEVLAGAWRLGHAATRAWLVDRNAPVEVVMKVGEALWGLQWAPLVDLPKRAAKGWLCMALCDADCTAAARRRRPRSDYAALALGELLELGRDVRHEQGSELVAELVRRDDQELRERLAETARGDVVFGRVRVAARALAALGDDRLLGLAEALFAREDVFEDPRRRLSGVDRMRRMALAHYVRELPAERALELARAWSGRGGYFETVVGSVFAEHATAKDRQRLERTVAERRHHDGGWDVLHELDALGRLADPRSATLLVDVARESTYSHARRRAVHALAAMPDAPGAAETLREALWDAEDEPAADGATFSPSLDTAARARVIALAACPIADPELVQRARRRLAREAASL